MCDILIFVHDDGIFFAGVEISFPQGKYVDKFITL